MWVCYIADRSYLLGFEQLCTIEMCLFKVHGTFIQYIMHMSSVWMSEILLITEIGGFTLILCLISRFVCSDEVLNVL